MAFVNIPRDRADPNYRYKMPKLMSKIEGRGNGIKTNISNMGEISRALKRPPMYPTKFFGCELGAMAKFEEAEEKALLNGAHKESDLVNILDKFIQMYVLCPGCELPEIDIAVKKGLLTCKCNACGYQGSLDNVHKAATYMVRNPPDSATSTISKKKKTKEERRAERLLQKREKATARQQQQRAADVQTSQNVDEEDEDEGEQGALAGEEDEEDSDKRTTASAATAHTVVAAAEDEEDDNSEKSVKRSVNGSSSSSSSAAAGSQRRKIRGGTTVEDGEDKRGKGGDVVNEETESFDEQAEEKKRRERRRERRERREAAAAAADKRILLEKEALVFDSPELQDVIERLHTILDKTEGVTPSSFVQELRILQVSQDFDAKCRMYVTLAALLKDECTPAALEKRMSYVSKAKDSSVSAADLLEALGHVIQSEKNPTAISNFPYFLQKLYGSEVLEAKEILLFYDGNNTQCEFNACKKQAAPFLDWLREGEDEDSEDDEEAESGGASVDEKDASKEKRECGGESH